NIRLFSHAAFPCASILCIALFPLLRRFLEDKDFVAEKVVKAELVGAFHDAEIAEDRVFAELPIFRQHLDARTDHLAEDERTRAEREEFEQIAPARIELRDAECFRKRQFFFFRHLALSAEHLPERPREFPHIAPTNIEERKRND